MRAAGDHQVVREVGNTGVRVNAAVIGGAGVAGRVVIVVAAESGGVHVAERVAGGSGRVDVLAHFPRVRVRHAAVLGVGLARIAEDVRGRFIQRAGLVGVN